MTGPARWRKWILIPIGALLLLEVAIQGAALTNLLPQNTAWTNGLFTPYGRIYQSQEGVANATTNNYGWYYPDFRLRRDTHRILLLGDSFIQALQIQPEEHMGVGLEGIVNHGLEDPNAFDGKEIEVLAMGMPGLGLVSILAKRVWPTRLSNLSRTKSSSFFT